MSVIGEKKLEQDYPIEIRRVANGWIVCSVHGPMDYSISNDDTYVFETFNAMTKWLDEHFTKPNKK